MSPVRSPGYPAITTYCKRCGALSSHIAMSLSTACSRDAPSRQHLPHPVQRKFGMSAIPYPCRFSDGQSSHSLFYCLCQFVARNGHYNPPRTSRLDFCNGHSTETLGATRWERILEYIVLGLGAVFVILLVVVIWMFVKDKTPKGKAGATRKYTSRTARKRSLTKTERCGRTTASSASRRGRTKVPTWRTRKRKKTTAQAAPKPLESWDNY